MRTGKYKKRVLLIVVLLILLLPLLMTRNDGGASISVLFYTTVRCGTRSILLIKTGLPRSGISHRRHLCLFPFSFHPGIAGACARV